MSNQSQISVNKKSEQLLETKKRKMFQHIFSMLDQDKDGLISSNVININDISDGVLEIIAPVLIEMEDLDATLNQEQFLQAMDRLFRSLSIEERNQLLNTYSKRRSTSMVEYPFHPKINEKSEQLAEEYKNKYSRCGANWPGNCRSRNSQNPKNEGPSNCARGTREAPKNTNGVLSASSSFNAAKAEPKPPEMEKERAKPANKSRIPLYKQVNKSLNIDIKSYQQSQKENIEENYLELVNKYINM